MNDQDKTKAQLVGELAELRRRTAELEASETRRKRVEEALRESEERYRNIVELAPDGILTVNLKGVATSCNSAFLKLTGFSRDEIVGVHVSRFPTLPIEDIPKYIRIILSAIRGKTFKPFDFIWVHKDGTRRWGEAHMSLMKKGSKIMGFQVILRDITERKRAEEERDRILNLSHDLFCIAGMDGYFKYLNPAWERVLGYTREEMLVRPFLDFIHPDDHAKNNAEIASLAAGGQAAGFENRYIHRDGSLRTISWTATPLVSEGLIYCVGRDVTKRKRTEGALRRERDKAQKYLDLAGVMMVALNEKGTITLINRRGCQILGYREEDELIGQNWFDTCLPPQIREGVESVFEQLMAAQVEPVEYYENAVLTSSGEERIIAWHNAVLTDGTGNITGTLSSGEDVTERRQAEEERERLLAQIREQAQQMRQVMDTVPEGVILLDTDGQVILANPVAEKDLAALADAKVGDTLTHLGDRPLTELLTSPPRGLWHEVTTDGQSFQVIARPIESGSTPTGWAIVIRDMTQQREIEKRIQQQERLAAVGQLAAGIAHDFNNIMATVVLYAQMTARMGGLPATVRERMETIDQQAGHATRLIQQVLDFSRRAVLERRPLDLGLLLKEHVKLLERTLPESIEIKLDCEPDECATSFVVDADPTRMQQMVTNLALNARDAMPEGGILRIELEQIEITPGKSPLLPEMEAGEWVQVTVSDTGTGIPPDVLLHIFDPFFTTKEPGKGSGLGLPQVHGIVGAHEGRIDVETELGKGTTFTIYLPVHLSKPSSDASSKELSALAMGQGETVLVVEDNTAVREALVESLQLLNYEVLEATNGRRALAMLEQHSDDIDLLLSDVVMPGMGGVALLHALRENGLTVPVVMLTGHPLEKEMEELRAQGMLEWLPKPPRLEELAHVMALVLKEGSD
jgi:two-component system cell cycle sensor histidine kinase/response regulator CckA